MFFFNPEDKKGLVKMVSLLPSELRWGGAPLRSCLCSRRTASNGPANGSAQTGPGPGPEAALWPLQVRLGVRAALVSSWARDHPTKRMSATETRVSNSSHATDRYIHQWSSISDHLSMHFQPKQTFYTCHQSYNGKCRVQCFMGRLSLWTNYENFNCFYK